MAPVMPSLRRPRSSVALTTDFFNEGPSQPVVDVEFRRKHSRQNKEIIAENVRHKAAMKVLNEEIGSLQEELMEVKQINRILSLQMKKVKEDQARVNTASAVQAVDALIAAMPALQALRQSMVPTAAALPVFEGEVARRNLLRNIGMTIATKPAVAGGASSALGCLEEEDEEAQQSTPVAGRKAAYARAATTSHVAGDLSILSRRSIASPISQSIPKSPLPHGARTIVAPPSFVVESPASSASPSPTRRTSASPKKKARRRRESGLLPPLPTDGPPNSLGESLSTDARPVSDRDEIAPPSSPLSSVQTLSESTSSISDTSSALTGLSELSFAEGNSALFDDDGKRGRRSRTSVNYKEPSLTKKMRKPDGVTVAGMLTHRQLLHDSLAPPARQNSGMRRKSVLPTSSASMAMLGSDSDNADVDDIDDCLVMSDRVPSSTGSPTQRRVLSSSTSSSLSEIPASSSSLEKDEDIEDEGTISRSNPNVPPTSQGPQNRQTVELGAQEAPGPVAQVTNSTSPRKPNSDPTTLRGKSRRSTMGNTKPAERVPARGSRTALANVPEPNYEPKSISDLLTAKAAAQATLNKPRPASAAKR